MSVTSSPRVRCTAPAMLALLIAGFCLGLFASVGLPGLDRTLLSSSEPMAESTPSDPWAVARRALERREFASAREHLLPLAEDGHAGAQQALARLYGEGLGGDRSHARAYQWFQRAAEQGEAEAQLALAALYAHGYGVNRDLARAAFWSTRAQAQIDAR